jgi:hypothetical protein
MLFGTARLLGHVDGFLLGGRSCVSDFSTYRASTKQECRGNHKRKKSYKYQLGTHPILSLLNCKSQKN